MNGFRAEKCPVFGEHRFLVRAQFFHRPPDLRKARTNDTPKQTRNVRRNVSPGDSAALNRVGQHRSVALP